MKDDVRTDMLHKKQNKSDHWVVIPLRDEAITILNNRFNNNVNAVTNAEFNRHIKTIKCDVVTYLGLGMVLKSMISYFLNFFKNHF